MVKEQQRYNMEQISSRRGETPPAYMQDLTMEEICAYYFNWHVDEKQVTEAQLKEWYEKARGWKWVKN